MNSRYNVKAKFKLNGIVYHYFSLKKLEKNGLGKIARLPYSIRILLELLLRQHDGKVIDDNHITKLINWEGYAGTNDSIPFKPARVILQDLSGIPALIDLASLRDAIVKAGGDSLDVNPDIPADLVIDHSVQVDRYGTSNALQKNLELEFARNKERYEFLHWAKNNFNNFRLIPPATGIIHQVNLEYLASVVHVSERENEEYDVFPDTLIGTDSHTTMINGLGVLGWGVGGIEAEADMLGYPTPIPIPEVIGVKMEGKLPGGTTATDLALKVTQVLRNKNVVGKFIEFFGAGLKNISLDDRATIANMAPEYGATCGFFPVDDESIRYLSLTGRDEEHVELVEKYCKENDLWYSPNSDIPEYTDLVEINLAELEPNISGPKRPQDLISLSNMKTEFNKVITAPAGNHGYGLEKSDLHKEVTVEYSNSGTSILKTGSLVIAAITSCTNTSNPNVMVGAGLLAKKAVEKGLSVPQHVKTSLAPGSKVVTKYLTESGLITYLDKLGFNIVGYGCTTCSGNSGPLLEEIEEAILNKDLVVSSVLSGNRNFEGRIHPLVKANYLASPPLVVAYALAGTVNIDLTKNELGYDEKGVPIYLTDIWPGPEEIQKITNHVINPKLFKSEYDSLFETNKQWNQITTVDNPIYKWDNDSTYIQNPPYFKDILQEVESIKPLKNLRVIGMFGNSLTTDHISPVGAISYQMPAGQYLQEKGVSPRNFNSYGARRGNHEVMLRGTFANVRIRNQLVPDIEGGYTKYWPTEEIMPIYDAAMKYQKNDIGLVVLAGKDYGMGSSRDWAAKGTKLLGVEAVIAQSYERIHRSNLVMMGVLPLQFAGNENADKLKLTGKEIFHIQVDENMNPNERIKVRAIDEKGVVTEFQVVVRLDNNMEIDYYRHGGILQMVYRERTQKGN